MINRLLKGILRCGDCDASLTPKPSGKKDKDGNPYLYYCCTNAAKDGSRSGCSTRSIPAKAFDDLIVGFLSELGKHPDIIKVTLRASNEAKQKALRPLKSKFAKYRKRHEVLSREMKSCLEFAKEKGRSDLADEFLEEAHRVASEKRHVWNEMERLRVEIGYHEQVVTDEKVITDSLLQFEKLFEVLPVEDKKKLLQVIFRSISVKRFDPEKDELPEGEMQFKAKIRTNWYLLNMDFFTNPLVTDICKNGQISSQFGPNWLLRLDSNQRPSG